LLKQYFGQSVLGQEGLTLNVNGSEEQPITVILTSARASGEMLLKAYFKVGELSLATLDKEQLTLMMHDMSWQTFHRTYAKKTAKGAYELYHDAEMLIGDQHTSTYSEIEHFFDRFSTTHDPERYLKPTSAHVRSYWEDSAKQQLPQFGQWSITIEPSEQSCCLQLIFSFVSNGSSRKHIIKIYGAHGRCIFTVRIHWPHPPIDWSV
jgi:hypothetical protein